MFFTSKAKRKFRKQFPWALLLRVRSERQHQLGASQKYGISGPIWDLLNQDLHFDRIPRFFSFSLKSEEQFSRDIPARRNCWVTECAMFI